jgi:pyrimidine 5'-nucleotidase
MGSRDNHCRLTTLFFDLDDTLYTGNGLWEAIKARMNLYMVERLGLPAGQVPALRRQYYETYGTTLRGLQMHHQVDSDDFLAYVHDLPLDRYLEPSPALREMLLSLPQKRWIFTNADEAHACRVLTALSLEGCFDGIVDVRAVDFLCKPASEAYLRAVQLSGAGSPENCVFLDDSIRNLQPAFDLGFTTVLVGAQSPHPAADYTLSSLLELREVMPQLWSQAS